MINQDIKPARTSDALMNYRLCSGHSGEECRFDTFCNLCHDQAHQTFEARASANPAESVLHRLDLTPSSSSTVFLLLHVKMASATVLIMSLSRSAIPTFVASSGEPLFNNCHCSAVIFLKWESIGLVTRNFTSDTPNVSSVCTVPGHIYMILVLKRVSWKQ